MVGEHVAREHTLLSGTHIHPAEGPLVKQMCSDTAT